MNHIICSFEKKIIKDILEKEQEKLPPIKSGSFVVLNIIDGYCYLSSVLQFFNGEIDYDILNNSKDSSKYYILSISSENGFNQNPNALEKSLLWLNNDFHLNDLEYYNPTISPYSDSITISHDILLNKSLHYFESITCPLRFVWLIEPRLYVFNTASIQLYMDKNLTISTLKFKKDNIMITPNIVFFTNFKEMKLRQVGDLKTLKNTERDVDEN